MHAWEAVQMTLNYIEDHISDDVAIETLAELAALSLFYYQRLFARLVKKPVREYIKLRRLARACAALRDKRNRILDVALAYGFGSHETFTRAFKDTYGITPAQYRDTSVGLSDFDKPDLLLNYVLIDEGVPLISEGMVLEMNRKTLVAPLDFLGVSGYFPFAMGKMLGERPGVDMPDKIWRRFFSALVDIPSVPGGRYLGVCYHGDAPDGYTTYFAGAEVAVAAIAASEATATAMAGQPAAHNLTSWQLPAREYVVCGFEAENSEALTGPALGRAMKYTRLWLKKHGLIADGFFPEIHYQHTSPAAYMELWIPFRQR